MKYIIDEKKIKEILIKASTYEALVAGGVKDWEKYNISVKAALDDLCCSTIEEVVEEEILPFLKRIN